MLRKQIEKRTAKGTYKPPAHLLPKKSEGGTETNQTSTEGSEEAAQKGSEIEFKLVPLGDEDPQLRMGDLPKKLKLCQKSKAVLTVKKHLHHMLREPIDNIEILCKNFPVADSHSLEYVRKTKWGNNNKTMVLQYKRRRKIVGPLKDEG